MNITYKFGKDLPYLQLQALFSSVNWEWESTNAMRVSDAIKQSTHVVTAWDGDSLVGLARSMDDGIWSANIDCVVVKAPYQRRGIGSTMLGLMMHQLIDVSFISVAPNETTTVPFYTKNGFELQKDGRLCQICK